jgi:hypothetical protein
MPRFKANLLLGQGKRATGWFMDFDLEEKLGLATMGSNLPSNHRFLFAHRSMGLLEGTEISV